MQIAAAFVMVAGRAGSITGCLALWCRGPTTKSRHQCSIPYILSDFYGLRTSRSRTSTIRQNTYRTIRVTGFKRLAINRRVWCVSDPYVALGASPAPTMIAQYATTVRQLTLYEPDSGEVTYLPVEKGWPLIGMIGELMKNQFRMDHLFEKHGGPFLMNTSKMTGYVVCIQDAEAILEAQTVHEPSLARMVHEPFLRVVFNGRQDRLPTTEEAIPWKAAMSKVLSPAAVTKLHVPLMIPLMTEAIRNAVDRNVAEEPTLWWEEMRQVAFTVATRAVLSTLISDKECKELYDLFKVMSSGILGLNFGMRDGIPGTAYNKAVKAAQGIEDVLYPTLLQALRDEDELIASQSVLGNLVKSLKEEGAEIMNSGDEMKKALYLSVEAMGLTFAGTDTTANSLAHVALYMSKHPEWLDRLWEEQQDLSTIYGPEVTPKVIQKSAVAAAVAQEVLRLGNPNVVMQRKVLSDTVVEDVAIPEGQIVWMVPSKGIKESGQGGFDPTQWLRPTVSSLDSVPESVPDSNTSEPKASCPEGYTTSEAPTEASTPKCPFSGQEFKQKEATGMKKLVFGTGLRSCSAQNLAVTEIIVMLVLLCREVKEIKMSEEEQDRHLAPTFPHPTGMPVQLVARN